MAIDLSIYGMTLNMSRTRFFQFALQSVRAQGRVAELKGTNTRHTQLYERIETGTSQ